MKNKGERKEIWNVPKYFSVFVFFSFILIVGQMTYISLFPTLYGRNMDEFAASRNTYSTTLYAQRGNLFDSEGSLLALNVSSYTVIAYLSPNRTGSSKTPLHVVDKEKTAEALSPLLNMTKERIIELLNKDLYQVELGPGGRGISELTKEDIQKLNLPGIDFVETYKRYYPNGNFGSYIIGYAKKYEVTNNDGTTSDSIIGELGIESKYNDDLTGTDGFLSYQKDRFGYKIPDTVEDRTEAIDGNDIYLTLDSNIQRFAESAIKDMEANYSPKWATISIMNAKTGAILAASTIPSFNPNLKDITNYQSPLVTYTIEPGSTMKIFSYLCAVDSGKYDSSLKFNTGSIVIGDAEVRDWNRTGWGIINLDQGLLYSSNVAASVLVQSVINKTELHDCLEKYGFGAKTGIELSNEAKGDIGFTYPIEVATASFGQGITTTVVQLLQGMSILANNGKMVTPHVIEKIVNPNNNETLYESSVVKSEQLAKTASVDYVKKLLYDSVNGDDPNATGRYYKLDGYDILGKTGTAQISSQTGGYLNGNNDYINSFLGMYPANNPEIIIYVAIQQPTHSGSSAIMKASKEMIANITKYLGLFDDGTNTSTVETYKLPSYKSKEVAKVVADLQSKNLQIVQIGNGTKVINQYPSSGSTVLSNNKIMIVTSDKQLTMPNLIGYSSKDLINISKILNIKVQTTGNGYVISQDIKEGTLIDENSNINIVLAEKFNKDEVN